MMKVFERVPHFICKDISQSEQWAFTVKSHSRHTPSNRAFKSEG